MAFDITVWCKGYNDINELGSVVKKNTHQFHKDGYSDFSQSEMDELTRKATDLCIQLTDYMNRNGIPHLQPKHRCGPSPLPTSLTLTLLIATCFMGNYET